jgi:hypothetical protein
MQFKELELRSKHYFWQTNALMRQNGGLQFAWTVQINTSFYSVLLHRLVKYRIKGDWRLRDV